jgi:CO dehydrogenase maturation factor
VIDIEAGLENLSRRIFQKVDLMILTADPSKRGLETVRRLFDLAKEMQVEYDKLAIVINRTRNEQDATVMKMPHLEPLQQYTHADWVVTLPDNDELAGLGEDGRSLWELQQDNTVARRIEALLANMIK